VGARQGMIPCRRIERTLVGLFTSFQLKSRDAETRQRAARSLGVRGRTSAVASLQPLLEDPEWTVRQAAVEALGVVADAFAVPSLISAVKAADHIADPAGAAAVRAAAVESFGRIGPAGLPVLLEALKDRHARLRETAIGALGAIGGPESVSALGAMVDDDRSSVRQAAASALARAAGPAAVPALRRALGHKDPTTRRSAADALGMVRDGAAVAAVGAVLADGDRQVREAGARALASIGTPEAVAALVAGLRAGDREMKSVIAASLKSFAWTPSNAAEGVVHAVLQGRFDEAAAEGSVAVVPLVAALADREPSVRRGALAALGRLGEILLGSRPHQSRRPHGGHPDRRRIARTEQLDLARGPFGVDAVARQELDGPEGRNIARHTGLVVGAAVDEIEGEARNPPAGAPAQIIDGGKASAQPRRLGGNSGGLGLFPPLRFVLGHIGPPDAFRRPA